MVQDRTSHGIEAVEKYTKLIAGKAMQSPESSLAFTTYRISSPQLYVDIDRERAQKLSVPISSIFETMQYNLGSVYVNDFNILNRVYRVMAQAEDSQRSDVSNIYNLKVPNVHGVNVPLGSVANIRRTIGPESVTRYNLYPAAEVMGNLTPGYSTGQAMAAIEKIAAETLPSGMGIEWTDLAFQEKRVGNTAAVIFAMCVLFVYLVLAALYESWRLPLLRHSRRASRASVRPLRGSDARHGQQYHDANRVRGADWACVQKRHTYSRIRKTKTGKGGRDCIEREQRVKKPPAPDPYDVVRVHSRRRAARLRDRLGFRAAPGAGNFGVLRNDRRHVMGLIFTPVFFYLIRKNYKAQ